MDISRQFDLEELAKGLKNARSQAEKEKIEKTMYGIVNESTTVSSLRNELIGALRVNDVSKIKRLRLHLQHIKLEETRGTSWGNTKGNTSVLRK